MIAIVCYATSIRIVNLPECKLRGLSSTYPYDNCESNEHYLTIQEKQNSHSTHAYRIVKNVFSLNLLEFQYLYDASMDQVFAACLLRYLRHLKTVPAMFLPCQYERTLCDNPM